MFTALRPLDSVRCAAHGLKRFANFGFARSQGRAPVVMAELPEALSVYPLCFVGSGDGSFRLTALLGLHSQDNLFVNQTGQWRGVYIPSWFRSYPFTLASVDLDGEGRMALCFDHDSGLYREEPDPSKGEERFFDDDGQLRPAFQKVLSFLEQTTASAAATQRAVDALNANRLLIPWDLPVANPDAKRPLQAGLFRVDEQALRGIGAGALASLHAVNALAVAHAQLFSTWRLKTLVRLYEWRQREDNESAASREALLGLDDMETLQFEWDED
jgi:hypothetical protein